MNFELLPNASIDTIEADSTITNISTGTPWMNRCFPLEWSPLIRKTFPSCGLQIKELVVVVVVKPVTKKEMGEMEEEEEKM